MRTPNLTQAQELIDHLAESLAVEVKRWINPDDPEGKAKIVKAVLALRNHGGGYLVIGFDNETLEPDLPNASSENVRTIFHIDKIQGIVSHFASEPFEISIEFPQCNGQEYPVIIVPAGIRTPVIAKRELEVPRAKGKTKTLIKPNQVYVRSLLSNNTPSTTEATWKDWPNILAVCFDNREADIGRFLRRHLSGLTPEGIGSLVTSLSEGIQGAQSNKMLLRQYLDEDNQRYRNVLVERSITAHDYGTWEIGLIIKGKVPEYVANQDFLNLLASNNPRYTGWPVWLDCRHARRETDRPYVYENKWEALIADEYEFMQLDPRGRFYLNRPLEDDTESPSPRTVLDFGLPVLRTAEAIAVGIAFAKAMGCSSDETSLLFGFQWSGLSGRELNSWTRPTRHISPGRKAYQDSVLSFVEVPLGTPLSAISQFVNQATKPLFNLFNGFELSPMVIDDLTNCLFERRL